jgi:exonuclease III
MTENNIDIYLLQETWLLDDWTTNIHGITVIHHGPKEPASNRGSGGVAIMLEPRAQHAWHDSGSPDPYRPGNIVDNTTRYMGIELLLFCPRKNQKTTLFVACVYAPYSEMETNHPGIIRKFYETVENHLLHLPSTTTPILGGDFNASIGVRPPADHDPVIGPYGLPHSNAAGETLTDMARNCSLQASATYFKHRSYETFYNLQNNRAPRQLDLIFVHQKHGMHVTDAGVFQPRNNVVSDHHTSHPSQTPSCSQSIQEQEQTC